MKGSKLNEFFARKATCEDNATILMTDKDGVTIHGRWLLASSVVSRWLIIPRQRNCFDTVTGLVFLFGGLFALPDDRLQPLFSWCH
eukprot:scaffold265645_cov46-Prasinocladus_malaysianus.AAC.1